MRVIDAGSNFMAQKNSFPISRRKRTMILHIALWVTISRFSPFSERTFSKPLAIHFLTVSSVSPPLKFSFWGFLTQMAKS